MRQAGGVSPRAIRCHVSVAHNQILNGAGVISSPFIGVELTCWKAPFFEPNRPSFGSKSSRLRSDAAKVCLLHACLQLDWER